MVLSHDHADPHDTALSERPGAERPAATPDAAANERHKSALGLSCCVVLVRPGNTCPPYCSAQRWRGKVKMTALTSTDHHGGRLHASA